jgi:hypothetical protein
MRAMSLRFVAARLLPGLLMLCLAGFGACTGKRKPESASRLVLVIDPTVLRDVRPADFDRLVGEKLRSALAGLPEDSFVDLFFVGHDQGGLPVDFRDSLPLNEYEQTDEAHKARADSLADTVATLVRARWAASNEGPNQPSSCILTALYRAQEMTQLGARRGEDVTLVVLSDFLEACSDMGAYNFERSIPDSMGALPVQADLSGADRVLMLRMQTSGAVALRDEPRLSRLWINVLKRWHVAERVVTFTPNFPDSFAEAE